MCSRASGDTSCSSWGHCTGWADAEQVGIVSKPGTHRKHQAYSGLHTDHAHVPQSDEVFQIHRRKPGRRCSTQVVQLSEGLMEKTCEVEEAKTQQTFLYIYNGERLFN